jgi:hypothetical protein
VHEPARIHALQRLLERFLGTAEHDLARHRLGGGQAGGGLRMRAACRSGASAPIVARRRAATSAIRRTSRLSKRL